MPSLLKQLFDTLPLAGAAGRVFHVDGTALDASSVDTLATYVQYLEGPGALSVVVDCPKPTSTDLGRYAQGLHVPFGPPLDGKDPWEEGGGTPEEEVEPVQPHEVPWAMAERIPIWAYRTAPEPNRFTDIACRSRGEGFDKMLVLEQAAWGLESPEGLTPAVRVNLLGFEVTLPLDAASRLLTFKVRGGHVLSGMHPLWPLHSRNDDSIVHVFAFDVHPTVLSKMALSDPNHPDASRVGAMLDLLRKCFGTERAESVDMTVGADLFVDDLWPDPIELDNPLFNVGDILNLVVRPVRIIVAVSLTCCRENWDYTPGSAAGMGRVYPQLFLKSHAPLNRVEATLHLDRPSKTTVLDGESCHCGEMKETIGSFLATDSNEGMDVIVGTTIILDNAQPFWSHLFAYYVSNLHAKHGELLMNVVRNDRPKARTRSDLLYRAPVELAVIGAAPAGGEKERARKVRKVARQGAFDNIHMAPRMRLDHGANLVIQPYHLYPPRKGTPQPIIADGFGLRDVVMAPFCAHDCFHLHWRWSDTSTDGWTFGWGPLGPNTVAGAVMIPPNQEIDIRLRADHKLTYAARATDVKANEPLVFCHHGAAYALMVGAQVAMARKAIGIGVTPRFVFESDKGEHTTESSWAVFYWNLRYEVFEEDGAFRHRERTEIYDLQGLLSM